MIAFILMLTNTFVFQNCSSGKFESAISSPIENTSSSITEGAPAPISQPVSATVPVVVQPPTVVQPPPPPPAVVVPTNGSTKTVFMASGHMGRTVMSCDDGKTWINDRSDNDNARCWVAQTDPNYVECDHTPYSARGLDANGGMFYTNHGWGFNGAVKKSRDGKNWETIQTGNWGGEIAAFSKDIVFRYAEGGNWYRTINQGVSWTNLTDQQLGFSGDAFDHPGVQRTNNKAFVLGRTAGLAVSLNQGESWSFVASYPSEYGNRGFAEGNGIIVSIGNKSVQGQPSIPYVAKSSNNGQTWSAMQLGSDMRRIIFNGSHFMIWDQAKVHKSTDGVNWVTSEVKIDGATAGWWMNMTIAYNPTSGTYAGVLNSWGNYYEKQKFYRSLDGINWTTLASTQYKGGHPLGYMTTGEMDSAYCQ